jgi:hypothetical protein
MQIEACDHLCIGSIHSEPAEIGGRLKECTDVLAFQFLLQAIDAFLPQDIQLSL